MIKLIGIAFAICCALPSLSTHAAAPTVSAQTIPTNEAERARALLAKAVTRFRTVGEPAFAEFSRQGNFIDQELYVYALGTDGEFLASGGSSSLLVGRNVSTMLDSAGKAFFAELIAAAKANGRGDVEYRWMNSVNGTIQRKRAYFERVDGTILAVGYYLQRSTPEQAKALLDQAAEKLKHDPNAAVTEFNTLGGPFAQDDLYAFVFEIESRRFVAHAVMPRMLRTNGNNVKDATGRLIVLEMIAQVEAKGSGEIDYVWANPVTQQPEAKHTFFRRVGKYIVGVGYYTR
ncbi:MAG: cache domain-containing protein [Azoarcus sp.]|nr:cache domain-containing protein [Azoarcus sp.]